MKIYLYSRVSTDKQTLEQQERTALEWLRIRNFIVDEIVSDEGISGGVSYSDRNLGKILIPKMRAGDILIVSEISRLGRSMYDLSKLINNELKERKIRLVIVSMGIDLRCDKLTAIDELILNNFAFAAQLEKQLIKERTISALKVKKQQGVKLGRASDNYHTNKIMQEQGRIKASVTRNTKTVKSPEFESFCRILQRVFNLPQDLLLQERIDLVTLYKEKQNVFQNLSKTSILGVIEQMRNTKADNNDFFKTYPLDNSDHQILIIRSKIYSTFRAIDIYIKNKNIIIEN